MKDTIQISYGQTPKVLFIGNGLCQLAGGNDWGKLLNKIAVREADPTAIKTIPYAMWPEVLCGVDVEDVQRKTASAIMESPIHPLLQELVGMSFDAVITTNYSYEIETALSGKTWTEYQRRLAFRVLHGSSSVRDNTCMCNMVSTPTGKMIPVFHIHGERYRKHSLVLSYYSYAKSVAKLHALNKERGDQYRERQAESRNIDVWSWLDYFILGDVYTVGAGFDLSEFDLWWAIERKAREKANHGQLFLYMMPQCGAQLPQETLAEALNAKLQRFDVVDTYLQAYKQIVDTIAKRLGESS